MDSIEIINAKMNKKDFPVPQYLYKYRPIDDYTYDMLKNRYLYFCPAENLDDPSECKVDFSQRDFFDLQTNQLTFKGVKIILNYIRPYTSEDNFRLIESKVAHILDGRGEVRRNFLLDISFELQQLVPGVDITPLLNWLAWIPTKLNNPQVRKVMMELFILAYNARQGMGICSLTEVKNSNEMWQNYAAGSKGYCIEYDMRNYENTNLLYPVVYQDNRENNIVISILYQFIGHWICCMSNGQIDTDISQVARLFVTKDLKWSYQKEWRLLSDGNDKLPAPPIHAIYLGKNMNEKEKQLMIEYCIANNIKYE